MPRFGVADGGGDVMASSNAVFRPVDHRKPDVPSSGTGSRIHHDRRSCGSGRPTCSRNRTGPLPHGFRVKDVDCRFRRTRCHRADLCRAPLVQGASRRTCHSNRRKSATPSPIAGPQQGGQNVGHAERSRPPSVPFCSSGVGPNRGWSRGRGDELGLRSTTGFQQSPCDSCSGVEAIIIESAIPRT